MTATNSGGVARNVSPAPPLDIASSTNTTPIVVTTSRPHELCDGGRVSLSGHEGNIAANGIWPIVCRTDLAFELIGSVGNGEGGATGTVQSLTPLRRVVR